MTFSFFFNQRAAKQGELSLAELALAKKNILTCITFHPKVINIKKMKVYDDEVICEDELEINIDINIFKCNNSLRRGIY